MAAYRLPYLLGGDALVLKQQSPYYEHFYKDLQEWQHYVPFKRDLSDLEEKLKWAMANDEKVLRISSKILSLLKAEITGRLTFSEKKLNCVCSEIVHLHDTFRAAFSVRKNAAFQFT